MVWEQNATVVVLIINQTFEENQRGFSKTNKERKWTHKPFFTATNEMEGTGMVTENVITDIFQSSHRIIIIGSPSPEEDFVHFVRLSV